MLSLEKIKSKIKKLNKLFTKAERLIALRNLRPKKRRVFENYFNFFFFRDNAWCRNFDNCNVGDERF